MNSDVTQAAISDNASELAVKPVFSSDSAEERGKRVRYVREQLIRLSRKKFCDRHTDSEISHSSIQNWEDGRFGGLTEKGAKKLIEAFNQDGIIDCTVEWLMFGIGQTPQDPRDLNRYLHKSPQFTEQEKQVIEQELTLYHQLNPNSLDVIVTDSGLSPAFLPGDHVAGILLTGEEIKSAIGKLCIIQTQLGQIITRRLEYGTKPNFYNLVCTNAYANVMLSSNDVAVRSVAPIVWMRRPLVSA